MNVKVSSEKGQISASVSWDTIAEIVKISKIENRKFSQTVDILLAEAVENRKKKKH